MYKFTSLTNEPRQQITKLLADGTRIIFSFEYKSNQLGWFFGFQYGDVNYQNIRLTTSYNILRAYRNWLPFGLRCDTPDFEEPMNIDDFVTEYASVYLLDKEDIEAIEGNYYKR